MLIEEGYGALDGLIKHGEGLVTEDLSYRDSFLAVVRMIKETFRGGSHYFVQSSKDLDRMERSIKIDLNEQFLEFPHLDRFPFADLFLWYTARVFGDGRPNTEKHLVHAHRISSRVAYLSVLTKGNGNWSLVPAGMLMSLGGTLSDEPLLPLAMLEEHAFLKDHILDLKTGQIPDSNMDFIEMTGDGSREAVITHIVPCQLTLLGFLKHLSTSMIRSIPHTLSSPETPQVNYQVVSIK